ncbi:unnamed protein product [Pleuronectes platessa]|uniref:Uncharacterized protein n=1 Tax=Pleuronectes platessa TaxID=8262 RepID=A0A9N7TWH1_PLEPL|nr:unnamed protein product [Pleuronectes platessa]
MDREAGKQFSEADDSQMSLSQWHLYSISYLSRGAAHIIPHPPQLQQLMRLKPCPASNYDRIPERRIVRAASGTVFTSGAKTVMQILQQQQQQQHQHQLDTAATAVILWTGLCVARVIFGRAVGVTRVQAGAYMSYITPERDSRPLLANRTAPLHQTRLITRVAMREQLEHSEPCTPLTVPPHSCYDVPHTRNSESITL